jgi:hypothetical protein
MRASSALETAALAVVCTSMAIGAAPQAFAFDTSINGEYIATSIGPWAQTNQRYRDEVSTISRWSIATTCQNPYDCTGTVMSDDGWTAEIVNHSGEWQVNRVLPNWEPCADGSFAVGKQQYRFTPIDSAGRTDYRSPNLAGVDRTVSDSGACGISNPLVIEIPFRLDKVN